jgi:predicted nucleic acid-binding protein
MKTLNTPIVDSNILIYAYSEGSDKKAKAMELLNQGFIGQLQSHISLQNIGEFCSVSTKKYGISPEKVNKIAQAFLRSENFIKLSNKSSTFQAAFLILEKHKLHFWDAMLAATMVENNVKTIYTEDNRFNNIEGIKAVKIFES